jgi:uncharacterized protein YndB with AHSA1/START domain
MIKIVLLIVALVIAIPLIIALFVKNDYNITRNIVINKPRQEVFNYIKFLKNQEQYSKWVMMDPNMKKEYHGTDGTVGFVYGWNGNKQAGEGEQEIKSIQEGERLDLEIRFKRPFEGVAKTPFITESISDNQTKVTWGMSGRSKYPMNFTNLFIDRMLGKDLDISLRNLKAILEKQ